MQQPDFCASLLLSAALSLFEVCFFIPYTLSNRCYFSFFQNFLIFFKKVLDFFMPVLYNRRAGCGWQPRKMAR